MSATIHVSTASAKILDEPPAMEPGTLLKYRYRLGQILGEGGMARVYEATDLFLDCSCVVKVPTREEDHIRLEREYLIASNLKIPGVCKALDFGRLPDSEIPFVVFKRLWGETLAERLDRLGRLPWREAVWLVRTATIPLGAVHGRGVVHRDLKPENLFVVEAGGGVHVLDFGVAYVPNDDPLTKPGLRLGTPQFMAPEYLADPEEIHLQADVYALGLVLACAIAGRDALPRSQHQDVQSLLKAAQRRANVRQLVPDLPEEVAAVIDRATAVDLNERYQTMEDLREALDGLLAIKSISELPRVAMVVGALGLVFTGYLTRVLQEAKWPAAARVEIPSTAQGLPPVMVRGPVCTGQSHEGEEDSFAETDSSEEKGSGMKKFIKGAALGMVTAASMPNPGVSGKPPQQCQVDSDCKKKEACKPAGSLGNWCAEIDKKQCPTAEYKFTKRAPERLRGKCWVPPTGRYDPATDY